MRQEVRHPVLWLACVVQNGLRSGLPTGRSICGGRPSRRLRRRLAAPQLKAKPPPHHRFAGNVDGLKQWLEEGNDVNTPAVWLMSRELLLHRAAKNGEIECMRVRTEPSPACVVAVPQHPPRLPLYANLAA